MKPLNMIKPRWSRNLAYLVGLITTDGSLSKDKRHIVLVSKDRELLEQIKFAFNIRALIGLKFCSYTKRKDCCLLQIGDVIFYNWLLKIGLMPNKTKIIKDLKIPNKYFFDFLRGHFDGDGCFYSYFDPRWKSSFMYYVTFISASGEHIKWLREKTSKLLKVNGCTTKHKNIYSLRFAKKESLKVIKKMYFKLNSTIYLKRKYLKVKNALENSADVLKPGRQTSLRCW